MPYNFISIWYVNKAFLKINHLWPRRANLSRPTCFLHSSIDWTIWFSASNALLLNFGRLLRPKPEKINQVSNKLHFFKNNVLKRDRIVPSKSMAYTGLSAERLSKLRHQRPTPDANPWSITKGVFLLSLFNIRVHILFSVPPMSEPMLIYLASKGRFISA